MALTDNQKRIIEALEQRGPQTIGQLARSTGMSLSYVRLSLQGELQLSIFVDKVRQPYIYSIDPKGVEATNKENTAKAKAVLMGLDESTNPILLALLTYNRKDLLQVKPLLESFIRAIDELDKEGKLVPTLGSANGKLAD